MRTPYALDTFLVHRDTFEGGLCAGRALCPDGAVRAVRFGSGHADTFFSVPASVQVRGRTVSGYVSVSTVDGYDTATDADPAVVHFRPYTYGRNANAFEENPSCD